MSRYYHTYPISRKKERPDYARLFDDDFIRARMEYNKNMVFRSFVECWNADAPELLSWTLLDFYKAFKDNGYQLKFAF